MDGVVYNDVSRSQLVAVRARYRVFGIYNVAGARCRPFKGTGGNTDRGGVRRENWMV